MNKESTSKSTSTKNFHFDVEDGADLKKRLDDVRCEHKAVRLRQALESLCVDAGGGDMRPAHHVAGEKFAELLSAANAIGKAGTLTIKLKVTPLGEDETDCVDVSAQVDVKLPKLEQRTAMWIDGSMMKTPQQGSLPLAAVLPVRNPDALRQSVGD